MPATQVLVVGATGRTGKSIVDGLLNSSDDFVITALTRESTLGSPAIQAFQEQGIKVVTADLLGSEAKLVNILTGIDVVISCIYFLNLDDQIPLIGAAKVAGVKRFVPCHFGTPAPRGVMQLFDHKEDILAAVQRAYLPYTVIDVGWWSEQVIPELPSGRSKQWVNPLIQKIPGDGNVPTAFTDLPDVGLYVAKIIADQRTLNKKVFAYTDVLTPNQVVDLMEEVSGEKVTRNYLTADEIKQINATAKDALEKDPTNKTALFNLTVHQYLDSWGVRGDNAPESAEYLGYLNFRDLYPEVRGVTMKDMFQRILEEVGK